MILLYILFFVVGIVSFMLTTKLGLLARIGIALAVFIIPSIVVTLYVLKVGDKPAPDARTVDPQTTIETPEKTGEKKDN